MGRPSTTQAIAPSLYASRHLKHRAILVRQGSLNQIDGGLWISDFDELKDERYNQLIKPL